MPQSVPLLPRDKNVNHYSTLTNDSRMPAPPAKSVMEKPFVATLLASVVIGVACMVCSLLGLEVWAQADYFHDPGPYAPNSWCGYDQRTFVGLVFFTSLPTVGFTLVYAALNAVYRAVPSFTWTMAYMLLAFVSLAMGCVGMVWGSETMKCFGVFCVDMEKYVEIPNLRPEAGIGFQSVVGIAAFSSLVPVALVMLHRIGSFLCRREKRSELPAAVTHLAHSRIGADIFVALTFVVLVGLLGVTTLYIPNSWEYFTAARIAKNAKLIVTTNATICNTYWNSYTCSEVYNAVFRTTNWQVSENLNLKLYPSNLFFYVYLMLVALTLMVARLTRFGRLAMKRHLAFGTTVGELLLVVLTVAMLVLFMFYWLHDHNYNGYWQGGTDPGVTDAERWARSLGQLAVVFLGLLFFPASRNSILHRAFGTSWEASLWAHRVLGYSMLAAMLGHMIAWYKFYDMLGYFPKDIFDVPMLLPTSIDNFTVPMSTLAAFLLIISMGGLALGPVRRRFFELFYYAHLFAAYFTIPVILWHAAAGWEYMLPGLTVWFVDRMIRMSRSASTVHLVGATVHGHGVTELRFLQASMTAAPGQYVFINIPELSLFQWHPFTLSTGSHSDEFSLHIKAMGEGTWTQQLSRRIAATGKEGVTLLVDGPYGVPLQPYDYKKVILIAGGIGITPCASIFSFLKLNEDVSSTLVWVLREEEIATAFAAHLSCHITSRHGESISVNRSVGPGGHRAKLFLTRGGGEGAASSLSDASHVEVQRGRPDMETELSAAAAGFDPWDVLVFVCGPEPLVQSAQAAASISGFHFHRETFCL